MPQVIPKFAAEELLEKLKRLNEIGAALSVERDLKALLEKILLHAQWLTQADAGTIYTITSTKNIHFEIVSNQSLKLYIKEKQPTLMEELPLFIEGKPNDKHIVAYAINNKKTINIADAYQEKGFDFSGTRQFDAKTGYKTTSVLTVPIKNHEGEVVAALQLINAQHPEKKVSQPFSLEDQDLAESLASQAGVALTNQRLISDLHLLFDSFVRVIAAAIDEKSPSTGNHGKRVPVLAVMLARAVNKMQTGPFKEVHFTEEQLHELEVAALLHDCGKITTPTHIVEKSTKLEALYDRIGLIEARFEIEKKEKQVKMLEEKIAWLEKNGQFSKEECREFFRQLEENYVQILADIEADKKFLESCNQGSPALDAAKKARIQKISEQLIETSHGFQPLLTPEEKEKLLIESGTLSAEERKIMENHVVLTHRMLSQLIYPKELREVPEIAASHHEWVNGKGYPRGLTKEQMSLRARILAVVDVFEALSAPDRPYKKPLPLSKVYEIMEGDCLRGHLDPELFALFREQKVGEEYAESYLAPEQRDLKLLQV